MVDKTASFQRGMGWRAVQGVFLPLTCDLWDRIKQPPVTLIRIKRTFFIEEILLVFMFSAFNSAVAVSALTWEFAVKTEKKTVQFSEDVQVETIAPEQEPVFIDEVSSLFIYIYILCIYKENVSI